jgi:hypothetical protein
VKQGRAFTSTIRHLVLTSNDMDVCDSLLQFKNLETITCILVLGPHLSKDPRGTKGYTFRKHKDFDAAFDYGHTEFGLELINTSTEFRYPRTPLHRIEDSVSKKKVEKRVMMEIFMDLLKSRDRSWKVPIVKIRDVVWGSTFEGSAVAEQ